MYKDTCTPPFMENLHFFLGRILSVIATSQQNVTMLKAGDTRKSTLQSGGDLFVLLSSVYTIPQNALRKTECLING